MENNIITPKCWTAETAGDTPERIAARPGLIALIARRDRYVTESGAWWYYQRQIEAITNATDAA